ncbi:fatty acid-binding protein DegV [Carnobacterium divergens]|uniref:DegV family protein n=1 Tax=Carnobacterium divergens TaxID=2748 RepID=UPI000D4E2D6B|nr:DegV family protein [Carnobacterium divergens]MCO6017635.1 DegV family protein [Carnobacterium divergens]MPQ21498.1 DegV family protein [Carnobacterium divergens]TFI60944.1 fatty acid-binding protein DegV [Carnobacterium divergens]TFI87967.1 fatty acid-binding protein DegV [Carnobacterium divergens]TFJ02535.1 fatty acid-binding protein DegV [Carnobacterium divergens]
MSFQLITDSCSDLPVSFVEEHQIAIISMTIQLEGKELVDDLGKTFDKEAFFQDLKNGKLATTSQINIGTYYERFKPFVEKQQDVLYLAFSSALSGSYNNALAAVEMLKEEFQTVNITVIDTKAACLGEGLLVYQAALLKDQGKSLSEVASWVEENKMNLHSWVTVDDLKHLERGGRISSVAATMGSLLNVKPIIIVNKAGGLVPISKVRGRKRSLNYLIDKTVEGIQNPTEQTILVGHVGVPEEAEQVKLELVNRLDVKDVLVYSFGPTIASHTGFGSIAIFSFGSKRVE